MMGNFTARELNDAFVIESNEGGLILAPTRWAADVILTLLEDAPLQSVWSTEYSRSLFEKLVAEVPQAVVRVEDKFLPVSIISYLLGFLIEFQDGNDEVSDEEDQ